MEGGCARSVDKVLGLPSTFRQALFLATQMHAKRITLPVTLEVIPWAPLNVW